MLEFIAQYHLYILGAIWYLGYLITVSVAIPEETDEFPSISSVFLRLILAISWPVVVLWAAITSLPNRFKRKKSRKELLEAAEKLIKTCEDLGVEPDKDAVAVVKNKGITDEQRNRYNARKLMAKKRKGNHSKNSNLH